MTAPTDAARRHTLRPRASTLACAALILAGGLLAAGCGSGASSSGASSKAAGTAHSVAGAPAGPAPATGAAPVTAHGTHLAALSPAGGSIVYTASLTVRAKDLSAAAARASQLAIAAGGYVSSETMELDRAHPARSSVDIQFKIPAGAYRATLARLSSQLGTTASVAQRARDVTQAVADVNSRVASAHAAIAQLRRLLAHAGSVSNLLEVQDQINQQESALEALLAQQRALAHETAYATVSLRLVSPSPAPTHRRHKRAGGFTAGLAAGWRALRVVTAAGLTVAGAVLPFAAILAVVAFAAYRGWRWVARRRARPRPAE